MNSTPEQYDALDSYPNKCAHNLVQQIVKEKKEYDIIVDLGCGTGYLADLLSQSVKHKRIVGVDVSPHMIAFAERNHKPVDSVQYLVQDLRETWDSLSPVLKALESKVSLIISHFVIHWIPDKSRLMHVVSKLLAKNGKFVAIYAIKPDIISMLTDKQIRQYNIKLKTQSEQQQLDEMRKNCLENKLQITNLEVRVLTSMVDTHFMNPDFAGPTLFGDMDYTTDKNDPKYAFMKNIMFDVTLRPDARALNPHAYDQLAANWDPNGPKVPIYVPSIYVTLFKI